VQQILTNFPATTSRCHAEVPADSPNHRKPIRPYLSPFLSGQQQQQELIKKPVNQIQLILLARGDSGSRKRAREHEEMVVDPVKGSRIQDFRRVRLKMRLLPAACPLPRPGRPRLSLFYNAIYIYCMYPYRGWTWMEGVNSWQDLEQIRPGSCFFHALGFSWSSHAPPPFFHPLYSFAFPHISWNPFMCLPCVVVCSVCVYIYVNSTTPTPFTFSFLPLLQTLLSASAAAAASS